MKTNKFAILVIIMVWLICGCNANKPSNQSTKIVKENTEYTTSNRYEKGSEEKKTDKVNIPYELRHSLSFAIKNNSIRDLYGSPDMVRSAKDYSYEIRNMDDGSKLFVFYSDNGIVQNIWRLKRLLSSQEFNHINVGKSTGEDIQKIDPYCVIVEVSEKSAISEHKLQNNQIVKIDYVKKNKKWIVNVIDFIEKDPSNFVAMLLPEDLKSIE